MDPASYIGGHDGGGGEGGHRAETTSLVVALSRSSCAPRLRGAGGARQTPERKETNPADITRGAQRVVCGVRLVRERRTYLASGDRLRALSGLPARRP